MAKKPKTTKQETAPEEKSIGLWDYVNSISHNKKDLLEEDPSSFGAYDTFMINRALSQFPDTILYANELNQVPGVDKDQHYYCLINIIRPRKRYAKWPKKLKDNDVDAVKEYYGFNTAKAESATSLLSSNQLDEIRGRLQKGGR